MGGGGEITHALLLLECSYTVILNITHLAPLRFHTTLSWKYPSFFFLVLTYVLKCRGGGVKCSSSGGGGSSRCSGTMAERSTQPPGGELRLFLNASAEFQHRRESCSRTPELSLFRLSTQKIFCHNSAPARFIWTHTGWRGSPSAHSALRPASRRAPRCATRVFDYNEDFILPHTKASAMQLRARF